MNLKFKLTFIQLILNIHIKIIEKMFMKTEQKLFFGLKDELELLNADKSYKYS